MILALHIPAYTAGEPVDTAAAIASPPALVFQTDIDSSRVVIDGSFVGKTPLTIDTLQPGIHEIRLSHPDPENWLTETISDTIDVPPGEARTLRYTFVPRYFVRSIPDGAQVFLGDSLAGTTPSVIRITSRMEGRAIELRKDGYEAAGVLPVQNERGVITVMLSPLWQHGDRKESVFRVDESNGKRNLRLYITGTATVLSGVAAAYFKVQADNRYDEFLRSGNPALRSETRRLDTTSGVALAITQIGLGLFTYFLLSE
jgi:hypothetical protein